MAHNFQNLCRAPYGVPNALQVTPEGLWVADQVTDRVALLDLNDYSEYYGVLKLIRDIPSESSNTSGLSYGDGALWLAANGPADIWRPARPADAKQGYSDILKVDPHTGETLARYPLPGGGGTHGLEYDPYEDGILWVTTLKDQTLTKMRIADWSIQHLIPLPYKRAHGIVRVPEGMWVVHTADRVIVKLDLDNGAELDRIEVPARYPEPHCLAILSGDLLYCDATSGWIVKIISD